MAGLFGMLHGLGFAGALGEVGLSQGEIPLALFSFNVGIELGQLAFVAVVVAVWGTPAPDALPVAAGGLPDSRLHHRLTRRLLVLRAQLERRVGHRLVVSSPARPLGLGAGRFGGGAGDVP
jgi:hypothetical protein